MTSFELSSLDLLNTAELRVEGRLTDASNTTLYCELLNADGRAYCVYKPIAGERPLWDFPNATLAHRELAAFLVSQALGWSLIPPTVIREGPYGPGMCQLWVGNDGADLVDIVEVGRVPAGWLHVLDAQTSSGVDVSLVHADHPSLRKMALLDVVINNADRKGGHVLVDAGGAVFGVDHGVSFHRENKLRTVLWGWIGQELESIEAAALMSLTEQLDSSLGVQLSQLLDKAEMRALRQRLVGLTKADTVARFPEPSEDWPSIPWPAF